MPSLPRRAVDRSRRGGTLEAPVLTPRRLGPADTAALCAFLASVNPDNVKTDPDLLRWQYWRNPYGSAVSFVLEEGGKIVSHQARIPFPLTMRGRHTLGAVTVDAATSASHRRRGLHSLLIDAEDEPCRQAGIGLSLAFLTRDTQVPSAVNVPVAPFRLLLLPTSAEWMRRVFRIPKTIARGIIRTRFPDTPDGRGREIAAPPDDVDRLWEAAEPLVECGVVKDRAWWRWRYEEHPGSPYRFFEVRDDGRLVAAGVTRTGTWRGAPIVRTLELVAATSDASSALLRTIAGETEEPTAVAVLSTASGVAAKLARAAGLWLVPRRFDRLGLTLRLRQLSADEVPAADDDWSIGWGDMDHV